MVKQVIAKNLKEALVLLNSEEFVVIAGGTDLMVQSRSWSETPVDFKKNILFIANIKECKSVFRVGNSLEIGSLTPLEEILHLDIVPKILKETIYEMASPAIRHTATLAGNIGNASPAGDSLVPLYLLDAFVVLESVEGQRIIELEEFITGPRQTQRMTNELITKIIIPDHEFTKTSFVKVGGRRADAISKVSFAGAVFVSNEIVKDIRICFGAVYKTVVRRKEIENKYIGIPLLELKERAGELVNEFEPFIQPIDDQRSNKEYRKKVALNLLHDFIKNL